MIGKKFDKLTVIKRVNFEDRRVLFLCKCDCGNEKIVWSKHLISGKTKSCGCYRTETLQQLRKDLTGRKFGKLTVVERVENYISPTGQNLTQYLCQCDCGSNPVVVSANSLVRGLTSSCGCINSKAEFDFELILKSYNIKFERQYKFKDCRNILELPFDFAIFNNDNKLIFLVELNGQQHYEPRFIGIMTEEESLKNFNDIQYRDNIKITYCKNNKIDLAIIPYWDFNKMEYIILNKIKGDFKQ